MKLCLTRTVYIKLLTIHWKKYTSAVYFYLNCFFIWDLLARSNPAKVYSTVVCVCVIFNVLCSISFNTSAWTSNWTYKNCTKSASPLKSLSSSKLQIVSFYVRNFNFSTINLRGANTHTHTSGTSRGMYLAIHPSPKSHHLPTHTPRTLSRFNFPNRFQLTTSNQDSIFTPVYLYS